MAVKQKFNPVSGKFDFVDSAVASGGSGGTEITGAIASQAIIADRVVKIVGGSVSYYDPVVDSPLSTVGIATSSVNAGSVVGVAVDGVLVTTLVPDGVRWAGPAGVLLTVPPLTGVVRSIGSVSGSTFVVEINDSIL